MIKVKVKTEKDPNLTGRAEVSPYPSGGVARSQTTVDRTDPSESATVSALGKGAQGQNHPDACEIYAGSG